MGQTKGPLLPASPVLLGSQVVIAPGKQPPPLGLCLNPRQSKEKARGDPAQLLQTRGIGLRKQPSLICIGYSMETSSSQAGTALN